MNRQERIRTAKDKLSQLAAAKEQFDLAQKELKEAEASFDEGELVEVTETCSRGCCVENEFRGVVVGIRHNG